MKKLFFLFMAFATVTIGTASDGTIERHEPKALKVISAQIYSMLGAFTIPEDIRGSKAEVRLAVDAGNYIRVLSVETENENLAAFIRSSIDFEKLNRGKFQSGVVYRLPIEVRK